MSCNVQSKIPCVFETTVVQQTRGKHRGQNFKVVASGSIREHAVSKLRDASVTEKVDGTCVLIRKFNGRPWLWARHDRKPTKVAEKRFRIYQFSKMSGDNGPISKSPIEAKGDGKQVAGSFTWVMEDDFRDVPDDWQPADGVQIKDNIAMPDENGHIIGWVPIDTSLRTHCWHATSVDLMNGLALVIRPEGSRLKLMVVNLEDLEGQTLELIGTHINGNPYGLGSKQLPIHALVRHGDIPIDRPTFPASLDRQGIENWFQQSEEGKVEGLVWHCKDGSLFKLHRHHMNLQWPVRTPSLAERGVKIIMDLPTLESGLMFELSESSLFYKLAPLHGTELETLRSVHPCVMDAFACGEK